MQVRIIFELWLQGELQSIRPSGSLQYSYVLEIKVKILNFQFEA